MVSLTRFLPKEAWTAGQPTTTSSTLSNCEHTAMGQHLRVRFLAGLEIQARAHTPGMQSTMLSNLLTIGRSPPRGGRARHQTLSLHPRFQDHLSPESPGAGGPLEGTLWPGVGTLRPGMTTLQGSLWHCAGVPRPQRRIQKPLGPVIVLA